MSDDPKRLLADHVLDRVLIAALGLFILLTVLLIAWLSTR